VVDLNHVLTWLSNSIYDECMARFRIVLIGGLVLLLLAGVFLGYYLYSHQPSTASTVTNLLNSPVSGSADATASNQISAPIAIQINVQDRVVRQMLLDLQADPQAIGPINWTFHQGLTNCHYFREPPTKTRTVAINQINQNSPNQADICLSSQLLADPAAAEEAILWAVSRILYQRSPSYSETGLKLAEQIYTNYRQSGQLPFQLK
jgi:hypothetical protein